MIRSCRLKTKRMLTFKRTHPVSRFSCSVSQIPEFLTQLHESQYKQLPSSSWRYIQSILSVLTNYTRERFSFDGPGGADDSDLCHFMKPLHIILHIIASLSMLTTSQSSVQNQNFTRPERIWFRWAAGPPPSNGFHFLMAAPIRWAGCNVFAPHPTRTRSNFGNCLLLGFI